MITYLSDLPQGSEEVSQVVEEVILKPEGLVPGWAFERAAVSGRES